MQRIDEQLNDPGFVIEWRRYMQYNHIANKAYTEHMLKMAVYGDEMWGDDPKGAAA